ncbi:MULTISPECIES: hypothetical protein [unclassified Cupriavidus]|uniref:hypothetical protein n=1 Tax=unclassified Cupriavidus TaxID=2640874 RepID=UPI001C008A01|nr:MULTISPECIES: hypothetical protein [unclassified Cupriavidus]MCA3187899.1 hypothetical protein [Cupriavidus sp.]MCA3189446.1 hypothetical protein [Cupriavidus sp.]MCA3195526.1 hypothetical protein [Cupriavidus sp.]MCA3201081.1 hypothetical protein [Cupriavidus sp.]MCA3207905.1 hypothetical protein [Cupriavidus sp.]
MEQAYAAIGRAVIAMQMFEACFVSVHEGFRMITDEAYREATGGMIDEKKYKTATANVVKALSSREQIAADLEDRLNVLIERRNELVHRWFMQHGWPWPDTNNAADYAPVVELAEWVRTEANAITHMMAGYMVKHAHPEAAEKDPKAYRQAMAELFHKLHVQE